MLNYTYMMLVAKVVSAAPIGFDGHVIEVESDITKGLPSFQIVGLGNKAIDEARERVKSAITNSQLDYPARRMTVNLAPAELPKDGSHYDLPIALSLLASSGQLRQEEVSDALFAGELALDGSLRPIRGAITLAETAKKAGLARVYLPLANTEQASLVEGIEIIGVTSLKSLFLHLKREKVLNPYITPKVPRTPTNPSLPTLDDIYGQDQAKRALVIAAAGRHNILLTGSPGAGKTMLARALTSLLPTLSPEEQIAVTKLHSLAGESTSTVIAQRPFRSPHHTASRTSLIGGGTRPRPGDISLAHLGVLFLDEIPEYPRATLEALRQPMEDKQVTISRANGHACYPADFMMIATMNPCPCGFYGDQKRDCTCSSTQILTYQKKLSGPLLDRIDLVINVGRVANETLLQTNSLTKDQHELAKSIIELASLKQFDRYKSSTKNNSNISNKELKTHIALSPPVRQLLALAADKMNLSARSYFKVIKVARTIADIENASEILPAHVSEALQYRQNY